ncbi:MAG: hypothetical protein AAF585_07380, partial [Verrucomicrobiota bacterium]
MKLAHWIQFAGLAHFGILIASAMVPAKLNWKEELGRLSTIQRQMYWIYGAYIVYCILAAQQWHQLFPAQKAHHQVQLTLK